ncbi:4'-phosphopantetheinyl transferase superfamily protein [Streptomyces sp. NPDC005728]|uniref:4'-phosphopantetheinyl transferase family protein n=1 Tax=Streptomyces sp. NPDC005728 TaxID=3157054 RepID=UPI0033FE850F
MIGALLPAWACSAETSADAPLACLHPAERQLLAAAAVERRRREFATGRACARRALADLGTPLRGPLLRGPDGAPRWPRGIRGSITHCPGYRAAAVAFAADADALGVDAERLRPLSRRATAALTTPEERRLLPEPRTSQDADIPWETVLFSAKEAAYKAWSAHGHPLTLREAQVRITPTTADGGRLDVRHARLAMPGLRGAYALASGLVVTVAFRAVRTGTEP